MDQTEHNDRNQLLLNNTSFTKHFDFQINQIKSLLSYGLNLSDEEINISFPSLNNFYYINNAYKSSWAIYVLVDSTPQLLFTGNFLIQGGKFGNRSVRSPFGAKALSPLTSIASTFSTKASYFKQNWTSDLALIDGNSQLLRFSMKEYKEFLKLLNIMRAQWLLYLSEEGSIDFVISEFSEPSDALFFMDLEEFDSQATKIKTYFKPISQKALTLFQKLSENTEFEGKFFNLQPGTWLRDDVLIELEKFYSEIFFGDDKIDMQSNDASNADCGFINPFKMQAFNLG